MLITNKNIPPIAFIIFFIFKMILLTNTIQLKNLTKLLNK